MNSAFKLNSNIANRLYERYKEVFKGYELSSRLYNYFDSPISPISKKSFTEILQIAFWASLEKVEDKHHQFTLSISPKFSQKKQEEFKHYFFREPLNFTSHKLAELAVGLESTKQDIGVWVNNSGNEMHIWGFGEISSPFLVKAFDAGQLIVLFPRLNDSVIAVIERAKVEFIDSRKYGLGEMFYPKLELSHEISELGTLVRTSAMYDYPRIGRLIREHSHGGTLLVVPDDESWRDSIQGKKSKFSPVVNYDKIKESLNIRNQIYLASLSNMTLLNYEGQERIIEQTAKNSLELLAHLTAVDGAVIVTRELSLLGFGAKITPIKTENKVTYVCTVEPFENSKDVIVSIEELGGTRHQSAAQFVYDQKDSFAIVASQDGKISVMYWDKEIKKVRVIQHAEYLFV